MNIYFNIAIGSFISFIYFLYITKKYATVINPVFIIFLLEFCIQGLLGYSVYGLIFDDAIDIEYLDQAYYLTLLYAISYISGSILILKFIDKTIYFISCINYKYTNLSIKKSIPLAFISVGIISYIGLMELSGAGLLWIIDTRTAYLSYRVGLGFLWSFYVTSIPLALFTYFFINKIQISMKLFLLIIISTVFLYFSGSKQAIFSCILSALFYIDNYAYKFSIKKSIALISLLPISFLSVTIFQGSFNTIYESLRYFDYIVLSSKYLKDSYLFDSIIGTGYLSQFWGYVPRILYPNKPFEYGPVLLNTVLFPGAAEQGYTPAYMPWTLAHLDFGIIGILIIGFLKGNIYAAFFRIFTANKRNLFLFLVNLNIGFNIIAMTGSFEIGLLLIFFINFIYVVRVHK